MGQNTGRSGRRWQTLARQVRATESHCYRCGQPIDWSIPYWADPNRVVNMDAGTVEHIKSWADHPHLREDPANLAASHVRCNLQAGKRDEGPSLGVIPQNLTG